MDLYVSTDIESDGPIPGPHSMLSLGSAAFTEDGQLVDKFYIKLDLLPGAVGNPATMEWWKSQPEAWNEARIDPQPPELAMKRYAQWVNSLKNRAGTSGRPIFAAYPAGFDFTFVYWYLMKFVGESPFGFSCLDIKTLAKAALGTPFNATTKKNMPKKWFPPLPHTHKAIDDALEQGLLLVNILKHMKENARV